MILIRLAPIDDWWSVLVSHWSQSLFGLCQGPFLDRWTDLEVFGIEIDVIISILYSDHLRLRARSDYSFLHISQSFHMDGTNSSGKRCSEPVCIAHTAPLLTNSVDFADPRCVLFLNSPASTVFGIIFHQGLLEKVRSVSPGREHECPV